MLHDLLAAESRTQGTSPQGAASLGAAVPAVARRERPRLLIVHHGDPRLAALELVLNELGYGATVVGTAEEAINAIARGPMPDVLLTSRTSTSARRGLAFARDSLARWPALRALHISFIPRPIPDVLVGRERLLAAPFNAEQLADALAALWPAESAAGASGP